MRRLTALVGSALSLLAALAVTVPLSAQDPSKGPLPLKYSGPATTAAITAQDLMTRLYIYADDSMMGRRVGTDDNLRATAYIEREVRRLGLKPAGTDGTFFQDLPLVTRALDTVSTLTAAGTVYHAGVDFVAENSGRLRQLLDVPVIYGGELLDTTFKPTAEQLQGKLVLFGGLKKGIDVRGIQQTDAGRAWIQMYIGAAKIAVGGDSIPAPVRARMLNPTSVLMVSDEERPITLVVTRGVAAKIFGTSLDSLKTGAQGAAISTSLVFHDAPRGGRNVVAILPGSDPKLRGEYVAIGAHNDHVGFDHRPVMHDSLRIFNMVGRPQGAEGGRNTPLTDSEWTKINADIARLRAIYPDRPDSIYNGADDDGSGTVSVLEVAEALAKGKLKPRRSILFVWHTGEESGMWGSGYYMDHPTVPRDSIVAQLNADMVGRGEATDITGVTKEGAPLHGGPGYLQLIGSRRLSTELGDLIEATNTKYKLGLTFDYALDANGHPQNIYCRSDHWSYAKWGVPIVFFTTGGHADYHQLTDEPQYIQYPHMQKVADLIYYSALQVANLDHRVKVDGPVPEKLPATTCQQ